MALRGGCFRIGRLARLMTAALISASILCFAGAPAEAHHYRHYRHYAHRAHVARYPRYAHYPRHARPLRYAHRAYPHFVRQAAGISASPAFSAIVVDDNSGKTLYSVSEDGLRHPASITKVMTLYLLFEELDRGAMTLRTQIPISEHAAAQAPSKLGLPAGDTISVDDAIKAIVTRSANDIAVAVAEAVGRTESNFAEMMTRKAHELGMTNTAYVNASGLPDDRQVTTARDLAILGHAMQERFPRYFHYFSLPQFAYDGEVIGNHDHLLGRVDGVDGIKTGYTRASGFNLLTTVHRGGRSLIAVVMGGRSAAGRDRIMENLIADHIAEASTTRATTEIADASPARSAARTEPRAAPPIRPRPAPAGEPTLQRVAANRATDAGEGDDAAGDEEAPALQPAPNAVAPGPGSATTKIQARLMPGAPLPPAGRPESAGDDRHPPQAPAQDEKTDSGSERGWMIQIGAPDSLAKANALLIRARERNGSTLASAKPLTQRVRKGDATLYRARFAVLDSASAEAACRSLKRNGFACFPAHDD
jgi:D-alanyl-D-alanine carboxypeptidase